MRRRTVVAGALVLAALGLAPGDARACSVCAAADPTVDAPGAEQPFARRMRFDLDALAGSARAAASDGRLLSVLDVRLAATAAYAPTRDVLLALVAPMLHRTIEDGATRGSVIVAGDAEIRAYDVAWRGGGDTARSLGLTAGLKVPTAPLQRDARGVLLPAELEPGCGSLVPYVGAAYSVRASHVSAHGSVTVYLPFAVREGPHPGDSIRATGWVQVQPVQVFAARFGVRARVDGTGELSHGVPDPNSGGFIGYATADLVVRPASDFVLSVGGAFPAVQALLGVHRETSLVSVTAALDL